MKHPIPAELVDGLDRSSKVVKSLKANLEPLPILLVNLGDFKLSEQFEREQANDERSYDQSSFTVSWYI